MTKEEKIAGLTKYLTQSERDGNEDDTFYHFTDEVPSGLKDLFLEHYNIADLDYEIFSQACDMLAEIYENNEANADNLELVEDQIYERASDSASVYTSTRLSYLNPNNEDEISDVMREYNLESIADACAVWYDKQVEQAAILITDWINE